ncbi:MAG: hypothetical protein AAFY57_17100 [Cyanobacteria bacterium J06642_2]
MCISPELQLPGMLQGVLNELPNVLVVERVIDMISGTARLNDTMRAQQSQALGDRW